MLGRLGRNGGQLCRARADGPQAGLHAGHDEATQKRPLCRDDIVGRGRAQIDCHAGQGIVCSGSGGIGNAVTADLGRLVHLKAKPRVQITADDQRLLPGQPLAGRCQHLGQLGDNAAYNDALTGRWLHGQAVQQKFHFGGILVHGAAGPRDHAGGERNFTVSCPRQPANADVGVADID